MSKHTPGPWAFDGPADNIIVWSGPNHRVCFMTSEGNAKANARLISAAPQLLEVVQLMQGANWKLDDDVGMEIRRRALAAVQKALDPIARDPAPQPKMKARISEPSSSNQHTGASEESCEHSLQLIEHDAAYLVPEAGEPPALQAKPDATS